MEFTGAKKYHLKNNIEPGHGPYPIKRVFLRAIRFCAGRVTPNVQPKEKYEIYYIDFDLMHFIDGFHAPCGGAQGSR